MKRFLLILLALLTCLSVVACREEKKNSKDDDESSEIVSKTETSETSGPEKNKNKLNAEKLIEDGKFEDAYKLIYAEKDEDWAKEMLSDFVWVYQTRQTRYGTTKYKHDEKGNVIRTEEYDSGEMMNATDYTYNEKNFLVKEELTSPFISSEPIVTEYFYDEIGRLIKRISPMAQWSVVEFTYQDNIQIQWCGSEPITRKTFDENGNLLKVENYSVDKFDVFETFDYDENGRLTSSQMLSTKTTYEYDEYGRLIKETKDISGDIFVSEYLDYVCIYVG